jgi:Undecaprenyl-phosphate glucose phosphotransferase
MAEPGFPPIGPPSVSHASPSRLGNDGWRYVSLSPEMLVAMVRAIDVFLVATAAVVGFALYYTVTRHLVAEIERCFLSSLLGAMLFTAGFQRIGGYTLRQLSMLQWQLTRAVTMWAVTISVLLLVAFVGKVSDIYSRGWAFSWAITALAFILTERVIVRVAIPRCVREGFLVRNVIIIGAGEEGERLIARLQHSQDKSIAIRGVFDDRISRVPPAVRGCNVLGNTDDLFRFAREFPVEEVIIALPLTAEGRLKALVGKLKVLPADLRLSAVSMAENLPLRGISYLGDAALIEIVDRPIKHWNAVAKWAEDKILGALLLFAVAPAMAVIALLIKLESRGPVFFVQERFGFNNNVIRVLKFRTMYQELGDTSGGRRTVPNDPRVTRVGRVLRSLSLDELPQLINVLRGEMSLIGPRAHAIAMRAGDRLYFEAAEDYAHRHRVKPGITGWAQVNGCRGEIDTLEKGRARVAYDLFYIERWSLWLDLKILALTLPTLLSRENAY